jgi:hypothetical protein
MNSVTLKADMAKLKDIAGRGSYPGIAHRIAPLSCLTQTQKGNKLVALSCYLRLQAQIGHEWMI